MARDAIRIVPSFWRLCLVNAVLALIVEALVGALYGGPNDAFFVVIWAAIVAFFAVAGSVFDIFLFSAAVTADGIRAHFGLSYVRWADIRLVEWGGPFCHVVSAGLLGPKAVLPRRWMLARPDSLDQAIDQHAPAGNVVRKLLRTHDSGA